MPTFDREWSLPRVLEAVLAFDYEKKNIRICFVDNNSTDGTTRIFEEFRTAHLHEYESIRVMALESNISRARNAIFEMAEGTDYVFFLDSDVVAPPDVVSRLVGILGRDPATGIAALPWDRRNSMKRAGILFRAFAVPMGPHSAYKVGNGCNMVSMKAVRDVGFFNERLRVHEDSEFSFRMRKAGFKIISDSSEEAFHMKEITVDASFYLRFMRDSARTYWELVKRGSGLHIAKAALSYLLLASMIALGLFPGLSALTAFLVIILLSVWLNSYPPALDDGAHARLPYRPLIGLIFTATTAIICILMIRVALAGGGSATVPRPRVS